MRFSVLVSLAVGVSVADCAPRPSATKDTAAQPVNSVNIILDSGENSNEKTGSGGAGEAGRVVGGPGVPEPSADPSAPTTTVHLIVEWGNGSGGKGQVDGGVGPSEAMEVKPTVINTANLVFLNDEGTKQGSGGAGEAGRVVGGPGVPEPKVDPSAPTTTVHLTVEDGSGGAGEGLAAGDGGN